jgi:formylglycine-generating enzyme required for sulfatase activity
VLTALYNPQSGDLPSNRGRLFAEYAYWQIKREERANHPHWIRVEVQLEALSHLGYAMQARGESTVLPKDRLLALLPQKVQLEQDTVTLLRDDLFDLACRAGLLMADPAVATPNAYKFSHQLLQEQFAAHYMLARWQDGQPDATAWWQIPRERWEIPPAQGAPPPPLTGWEQVTILAAGRTDQPDAFVRTILAVNPALAGRCVSEGAAPVSAATCAAVQQALLTDLGNPDLHRCARLYSGHVLGAVGDPRFTPQAMHGVKVILPDLVLVPDGTATIGSARWPWGRQAYVWERPRHQVRVVSFYLARFPVTNAEYDCFMQAGGYEMEHYWTPTGWQWRQGRVEHGGPVESEAIDLLALARLSEEEARQQISQWFSAQPHDHPYHWNNPVYNAPNQPVVGVTWYEAMAYCAWLHEQLAASSQPLIVAGVAWDTLLASGAWEVRLPTEAEWEWAAGGRKHRLYPWGNIFTRRLSEN